MKGKFIIDRNILESDIWQKPSHFIKIWVWILANANWKQRRKAGKTFHRGEFFTSYREAIEATSYYIGWRKVSLTKKEIFIVYEFLRKTKRITTRKATRGFWVKVLNYDKYQLFADTKETMKATAKDEVSEQSGNTERVIKGNKAASNASATALLREKYQRLSGVVRQSPKDFPAIEKFLETHPLKDAEEFVEWYLRHPVWGKSPGAICTLFQPQILEEWEKNKKDNEWQYG